MGWSRRQTGLTYYDPARASRGSTLFAPNGGDSAYLIDMEGRIVHRWHCPKGINHGYLLPNGNTLVGEGYEGRLFEVTPRGEVVWEWISPFFMQGSQGSANRIFRAHRYGPDHPALHGRDLEPARYGNLNRLYAGTR